MKSESQSTNQEMLYQVISAAFCVLVVLSNIISAKMVRLSFMPFSIPAGLVTYPLTFLLSDLVTEIFGPKKAKLMVYMALAMSLLSFCLIEVALLLPSDPFEDASGFRAVLGLSGFRLFSSLTAYILSQIADIQLYAWIRKWTGPRFLWVRNNGSTCLSQLIDTVAIDLIFLYWGLGMTMGQVWPIMVFSYAYKALFSFLVTPLFYLCVFALRKKLEFVRFSQI